MKQKIVDILKSFKVNLLSYFKNNKLFVAFVVISLINTSLLRFFTVKNYFDLSPVLGDAFFLILVGSFGFLMKNKSKFVYYLILSIIFTLICIINSIYYSNYLSFVSVSLIQTSLQITDVADAVVENIFELKDLIYLWQIFAIIFINKSLKKRKSTIEVTKKEGKLLWLKTLICGFIILGFFSSTLTTTDISRLGKQWNREFITLKFGALIYQANDIVSSVNSQLTPLFNYDENAKLFREYYDKKTSNEVNMYTNIFEGKNLLMIHAESIQQFTMDKSFNGVELTPNLNKLASEGLFFSNFYAQESVGTSSDSEFTLNTSLLPSTNGTVFVSYWDREYVSIPKLLKEKGYYTFSMHGNNGTFWNRNVMHKKLGYDDYYYYTKDFVIDETIGLGLSDKSFFRQAVPKIKTISENNKNYYGTLIMLTNHTPFTDIENVSDYEVDYKYEAYNEETGEYETLSFPYLEGTKLGSYFKSVHYADEALGELIEEMDSEGLLENTVVVIYGDHDAKLKKSEYEYYYNYNLETGTVLEKDDENYKTVDFYDYELNRKVPLIIWSKEGLEHKEIKKVMGMDDVLPTLGNMFGFSSDYELGHDIFSVKDNIVVFPDGNWLTDKMYYNSQKEEGKLLNPDDTVSVEYIEENNKKAEDMISVSNAIIVYDLIKRTRESDVLINGLGE